MTRRKKGFWNYEKTLAIASEYNSRSHFMREWSGAYAWAKRNKFLDAVTSHMKPICFGYKIFGYSIEFPSIKSVYVGITNNLNRRKWQHLSVRRGKSLSSNPSVRANINLGVSFDWVVFKDASNKDEAKLFEQKHIDLYASNGWVILNEKEAGGLGASKRYWTKYRCLRDAKKYTTRTDWVKANASAYYSANTNGWLEESCAHMENIKKINGYWNDKELCRKEALKYNRLVDFQKESSSAYKWVHKNKWFEEVAPHLKIKTKPVGYWHHNKEACIEEAKKYKTRKDLIKHCSSVYTVSCNNGWIKDVCAHMPLNKKVSGYWKSIENCLQEALKYQTRGTFAQSCPGAYNSAKNKKWLDIICKHMVRGCDINKEKFLRHD